MSAPENFHKKRKRWLTTTTFFSVPCYNGTMLTKDYYSDFFEIGQLKINFSFFELGLPDDDPVYTLKKVMEELDFSGLLACYSDKGRTGFNPIMLYAVVTYANMRGVRAVDRIVDLCQRDLAFIWLTKGEKPQRDAFYNFKGKKLTGEVLDELNYQFMRRLEKEGLITLKELYIDGTKIEANANRYTFVWRGSLNYHLAGLLDTIDALYTKYNAFLLENGYGPKYDLGDAHMFVIDGMDKVRKVIEENRKRKLTKHKKISNNTIIEIDNCSPIELLKLQKNLMQIAQGEGIEFIFEKGKRRPEIQKLYEKLEAFGDTLEAVTADSGYCGEKNLLYLKENEIRSFIKLQDHEKRKTRAYGEDIGKYYNMRYAVFEDEHYYICHDGRELRHIRTESKEMDGYTQTVEVYGCADCSGCAHKSKCLYKYSEKNPDRNKMMKVNGRWEELKEESNANIQSEEGILKRQIRSIQTEGHFGDIKENEGFRRFNYRSEEKVYKEFMLYAIGRNIMKYHRFLHQEIKKFEGKKEEEAA